MTAGRRGATVGDAHFNVRTDGPRYEETERHVGAFSPAKRNRFGRGPQSLPRRPARTLEPSR